MSIDQDAGFFARRSTIERLVIFIHYFLDVWLFICLWASIGFFLPLHSRPMVEIMLDEGNPIYVINLLFNTFAYFTVATWAGYTVCFGGLTTMFAAGHVDI